MRRRWKKFLEKDERRSESGALLISTSFIIMYIILTLIVVIYGTSLLFTLIVMLKGRKSSAAFLASHTVCVCFLNTIVVVTSVLANDTISHLPGQNIMTKTPTNDIPPPTKSPTSGLAD